jgi:uncharacterized protein YqjF (DUF2071 family)
MTHDRWANALFLHWKVPSQLVKVLEENTYPFLLDRYSSGDGHDNVGDENQHHTETDDSVWIGLILLTEQNVGPSVGRSKWTTVTHHGVNVRTYVRGIATTTTTTTTTQSSRQQPGIHFSSLECDDEFTSYGANFFGMPYKVARIVRSFEVEHDINQDIRSVTTADISDRITCGADRRQHIQRYRLRSERLSREKPSLWRILSQSIMGMIQTSVPLHSTKITQHSENQNDKSLHKERNTTFTVDCSWSCGNKDANKNADTARDSMFARWVMERYFVYTNKYGLHWRGQVEHDVWPAVDDVTLEYLDISGIESYEPKSMRPILQHMADNTPGSVLFSPGVGPVHFNMLHPV